MFRVDAPDGCRDIASPTVWVEGQPLPSLVSESGIGSIPFIPHRYFLGRNRAPTPDDLLGRVRDCGQDFGAGEPSDGALESEPLWLAAGSYRWKGAFV